MASLLHRQLRILPLTFLWTHLFWTKCYSVGDTLGASMLPTINVSGDWIVISKFHSRGRGIIVGDLVSYAHPIDGPDVNVVKRVIGLEGDFVVKDPSDGSGDMLQVPKGHIWTTGDNLPHSLDSRIYGPVPMALVRGKVIAKGLPWGWIKNPFTEEVNQ
ncbi:peptidase S24/S26A/S26B/S26C [Pyronema domesticum]|uniref:Similar to Mitochondrial inner membrane protease subunit 1 acc. no. O74800 n=1 Tax=Pyronema omphalodes (strain CBS 100304) TaxID=1076935 RepID=U4L6F2_PYROM|nr:peptidase S24/S26A/S26B/S26C [Pyronema domesticum]CCX12055.1 Similar to Mitochondrial inner membrane protease subunit 1; acc. no. O74800 [Pyronema omphalodes CBS 100304]